MSDRREMPIFSTLPAKRFHSCVLTTFSFDFNYFDHNTLAELSRAGVRNICVYVDDLMLQNYLGNLSGYSTIVGRRYSLSGIMRQGAFHPKISLFFGRDGQGFLIIGSGNLTSTGHGNNHEIWGAFHIDGPDDRKAPLFRQAWDYIKKIGNEAPGMSIRKLEWIETNAPWLRDIKQTERLSSFEIGNGIQAFFLTNTGSGILKDLQVIVQDEVIECTIVSPFFDSKASVIHELERLYKNAKIHIIVQPETCGGDFAKESFKRVQFFDWNTILKQNRRRYLHAKILNIKTKSADYCLFGSANLTAPALGTRNISPSNEEVCLLLKRKKGNWLEEIGLAKKGEGISAASISNPLIESINSNTEVKSPRIRLKAIDRLGQHIHLYTDEHVNLKTSSFVMFNGWGEEQQRVELSNAELKKADGYYDVTSSYSEDILFGQLFDARNFAISNKQIIHDMSALSRTNPDPSTKRLEEVLDRIELADAEMIEILSYLDPDDLRDDKIKTTGGTKSEEVKKRRDSDGTGEKLSYEDFTRISPEYQFKEGISYLYGTHRIERILDTLRTIFTKMKIRDIDISQEDEEADKEKLEASTGRKDEDSQKKELPPRTPSAYASLRKSIFNFFNRYIAILEKQRQKKHRPNVLDTSMFAIALHLLIDFLGKPVKVKMITEKGEYDEILLKAEGEYFESSDFCWIATNIIGKFTMLLLNGIDDANDEYVRRRIDKCRRLSFWHAIYCIAMLAPPKFLDNNGGVTTISSLWKWELAMNLRHSFAPDDADAEIAAREEIDHRIEMSNSKNDKALLMKILNIWFSIEKQYQYYKNQNLCERDLGKPYEKGNFVYCKYIGFAHLIGINDYENMQHKVTIARVGYPESENDLLDFEADVQYVAEIAKVKVLEVPEKLDAIQT